VVLAMDDIADVVEVAGDSRQLTEALRVIALHQDITSRLGH